MMHILRRVYLHAFYKRRQGFVGVSYTSEEMKYNSRILRVLHASEETTRV